MAALEMGYLQRAGAGTPLDRGGIIAAYGHH